MEIATRLGQSDVFDSYGYAAAEWLAAGVLSDRLGFGMRGPCCGGRRTRRAREGVQLPCHAQQRHCLPAMCVVVHIARVRA